MRTILPDIGVVTADEPATYLITPFQNGLGAYEAFLRAATRSIRVMIYSFTLEPVVDILCAQKQAGVDVKLVFDESQAHGHAEAPAIAALTAGGFRDRTDFVVGTSPEHHAINHLKASWVDSAHVFQGSWNYSLSATQELNSIEIVTAPKVATTFDQVFRFAWAWILQHEPAYNAG